MNNIGISITILECVTDFLQRNDYNFDIKIDHISTDEVYGSLTDVCEDFDLYHNLHPNNPYSVSKVTQEHLLQAYHNTFGGFDYKIYRLSNQFGKYQLPEKMIPRCVSRACKGDDILIHGDGSHMRQWSFCPITMSHLFENIMHANYNNTKLHIADSGDYAFMRNIDLVRRYLIPILRDRGIDVDIKFVEDRPGNDKAYRLSCNLDYFKNSTEFYKCMEGTVDEIINFL